MSRQRNLVTAGEPPYAPLRLWLVSRAIVHSTLEQRAQYPFPDLLLARHIQSDPQAAPGYDPELIYMSKRLFEHTVDEMQALIGRDKAELATWLDMPPRYQSWVLVSVSDFAGTDQAVISHQKVD